MTDTVPESMPVADVNVAIPVEEGTPAVPSSGRLVLMLGALGVVYGDIGTSPLYAMQTVFSIDNGAVHPTRGDVLGAVSLVVWSITLIVSIKCVTFVLHERVIIISGQTANVPHIHWNRRITVDPLGDPTDGIIQVTAEFGFQDVMNFPEVVRRVGLEDIAGHGRIDTDDVTYFVSLITLQRTDRPGMSMWRKELFMALAHNAASQVEFLGLPLDRTIVIGTQIAI